jgi:hypothetical protein
MMPSRSQSRSFRRALGLCSIALLAVGLLAPSAKASHCGRYVEEDARFRRAIADLLSSEPGERPSVPIPPAPPCSGALCSGQPAAPATPVATPTLIEDHWPCPVATVAIACDDSRPVTTDEADARPVRRGLSIFHPPRLPSSSA